ncbi:sigma-70 family RNA polymerase sigma factor [Streptomyces sp. NPDC013953]|uniref:sigma-70 family RNA polymerase sigma factor n=1 Tax=Streptomyces sp. NPDC013953 TaxID=3364868 RepID=UPI0036F55725
MTTPTGKRAASSAPAPAGASTPTRGTTPDRGALRVRASAQARDTATAHGAAPAVRELVGALAPLLVAEAQAEAAAAGVEAGDLQQAVWLRLLERLDGGGPGVPAHPADWLRRAVRAEARRARRTAGRERPYGGGGGDGDGPAPDAAEPERAALVAERRRTLRAAIARTPTHCRRLLTAMLSPKDPTYREIAGELGISQGSLGPMRSRCLGCLRRMLAAEVAAPEHRGKVR